MALISREVSTPIVTPGRNETGAGKPGVLADLTRTARARAIP